MNKKIEQLSFSGLGNRKTSVAKVFLKEGSGQIEINKQPFQTFFSELGEEYQFITNPFLVLNLPMTYDCTILVQGGGYSSQLGAIQLAIAKALCIINTQYRSTLKKSSFLHRDARIKERRKYGLKKARKASQYSKR